MTNAIASKTSPVSSAADATPVDYPKYLNTHKKAATTLSAGVRPSNFLARLMEDAKQEDLRQQAAQRLELERLALAQARFAAD